jgi:hypothetical protein
MTIIPITNRQILVRIVSAYGNAKWWEGGPFYFCREASLFITVTLGWDYEKNEITLARIADPSMIQGHLNFNGTFTVALDDVDEVIRGQHPVKVLRAMTGQVECVLMATEKECRRIGLIS